jgi:hypothetical protein
MTYWIVLLITILHYLQFVYDFALAALTALTALNAFER